MINDKLGNICNTFNGNYFLNKKNFYKSLRKNIKINEKKKTSKEHTVAIYKKTEDTLKILYLIHI